MSQTWTFGSTQFVGSSDLSGEITMVNAETGEVIGEVPGDDLMAFMAGYIRERRIEEIKKMSAADIMKMAAFRQ